MKTGLSILLTLFIALPPQGLAARQAQAPMEVVGLFKNMAVIRMNGGESLIKVGQTNSAGVTLVSADANGAVFRYRGEDYSLGLTKRVTAKFKPSEKATVSINSDPRGQYRVRGAVNSQFVDFLVDTGASVVAMSSDDATSVGIDYQSGGRGKVQTAQGIVDSYHVTLPSVTIGGITVQNVDAAVIEGSFPVDILLGMSFLSQVALQESGGVLTLTARY